MASLSMYMLMIYSCLSFKPNGVNALGGLYACIQELKIWFTENVLMLNEGKTKVILFGPSDALMIVIITLVICIGGLLLVQKTCFIN